MCNKAQSKQACTPKNAKSAKGEPSEAARNFSKETSTPDAKPGSKTEKVVALLQRPNGATLGEMVAETGWQAHSTRAALTGLKKRGLAISSEKAEGVRRYRVSNPQ